MITEADCKQALDMYSQELSALPNVQGLGIGDKGKECVVIVYVTKKISADQLPKGTLIPRWLELPTGEGPKRKVRVKVVEQEEVVLQ